MIRLTWMPINRKRYADLPVSHGKHMPLERAILIGMLDPDLLYGAADIAGTGFQKGTKDYERARKSFWYFGRLNNIHINYDNLDKQPGDPPQWCGSSWQDALGWRMNEVAIFMDTLSNLMDANQGCDFYLNNGEITVISPTACDTEKAHNKSRPISNPFIWEKFNPASIFSKHTPVHEISTKLFTQISSSIFFTIIMISLIFRGLSNEAATPQQSIAENIIIDKNSPDYILEIAARNGYEEACKHLSNTSPYLFGVELLTKYNRLQSCIHWFKDLSESTYVSKLNREEYIFGYAWALWYAQNTKEAMKISIELDVIATNKLVKTRNLFLLGSIYYRTCQFDQSMSSFQKSLNIYQELNQETGVFRCLIEMARVAALTKSDSTFEFIDQAKTINKRLKEIKPGSSFDDFYYIGIYRDVAFMKGQHMEALKWAKKEEEYLREKPNKAAWTLSLCRVGIAEAICGNLEQALKIAKRVDISADELGLEPCKKLNLFIWYMLGRCRGVETFIYERELDEYARQTDDGNIKILKNAIDKIICK